MEAGLPGYEMDDVDRRSGRDVLTGLLAVPRPPQACQRGHSQHLEHLLFYGAEPGAQNASGNTALHICALYNKVRLALSLPPGSPPPVPSSPSLCPPSTRAPSTCSLVHPSIQRVLTGRLPSVRPRAGCQGWRSELGRQPLQQDVLAVTTQSVRGRS